MMKFKTRQLAERLVSVISRWPDVECVSLNEAALPDILDPYFALILDIYYDGSIPDSDDRYRLYGQGISVFETSNGPAVSQGSNVGRESKDRFLSGDIPVRLEYKSVRMVNSLVSIAEDCLDSFRLIKDSGTYGFYRLVENEILFSRSGWIDGIRSRIGRFGGVFWQLMRDAHESKMEHFLGDLGAAVRQGDDFFYLISAAGFIKTACLTLFCINRRFEPSHRAYYKQVTELPELPESFGAQLEVFLRPDPTVDMERKLSLAQLIAKGIVAL
jgi:hypothetical protein